MSNSAHVVDGEASESDSEIELGRSPVSKQNVLKTGNNFFFYDFMLKKGLYFLGIVLLIKNWVLI